VDKDPILSEVKAEPTLPMDKNIAKAKKEAEDSKSSSSKGKTMKALPVVGLVDSSDSENDFPKTSKKKSLSESDLSALVTGEAA
jgi:hypothetical protein